MQEQIRQERQELIKRFVVTGNWIDKATKSPKTGLVEIKEGQNKENGNPYQMTDQNSKMIINGTYQIGTLIQFKMVMMEPEGHGEPQSQNLRINKA